MVQKVLEHGSPAAQDHVAFQSTTPNVHGTTRDLVETRTNHADAMTGFLHRTVQPAIVVAHSTVQSRFSPLRAVMAQH